MKSSHHFFMVCEAAVLQLSGAGNVETVSFALVSSLTVAPLPPFPSTAPEQLHINKPSAAGLPEATGWTTKEGTEV